MLENMERERHEKLEIELLRINQEQARLEQEQNRKGEQKTD